MFMRLLKRLFILSSVIIAVIVSIPFIIPLDHYQPILEEHLSQSIGRKVMIGTLSPQATPLPALSASNISVLGTSDQPGELFVEQMRATLDPLALLRGDVVISSIHLKGAGSNLEFINALLTSPKKSQGESSDESTLRVHQISGENIMIRADSKTSLGPYRFSMQLGDRFDFKRLSLSRMDNTLRAIITPNQDDSFQLRATGKNWVVPASPSFKFDKLNVQAVLHKDRAELTSVVINGYEGLLKTSGTLSWGSHWRYNGNMTSANVQMATVLKHFDISTHRGRFHSVLKIALEGNNLSQLFIAPEAKGTYHITNGAILNEDDGHTLLSFNEFAADGQLTAASLINENSVLKTAGGTIQGITHLSWEDNWNIKGWVVASDINAETFLSGFLDDKVTSGTFYATAEFNLIEDEHQKLFDRPYLAGDFKITDGQIYKADLEKASTTLTKEGSHGGVTPFQHLTGKVVFEDNHVAISDIDIISNSIHANGDVNIDAQNDLSGEVTVALRKTASIISAPLKVSGTMSDPSLRLSNDAIIGGVIGTSVLGPGVGTAVGMKVGRIIKNIGSALGSGGPAKADLIPVQK